MDEETYSAIMDRLYEQLRESDKRAKQLGLEDIDAAKYFGDWSMEEITARQSYIAQKNLSAGIKKSIISVNCVVNGESWDYNTQEFVRLDEEARGYEFKGANIQDSAQVKAAQAMIERKYQGVQ